VSLERKIMHHEAYMLPDTILCFSNEDASAQVDICVCSWDGVDMVSEG
jgi:hypothetical protein